MTSQNDESNPYELLGVGIEATEAEIKTAYRQRSLKVHPDRHPNNPDAANKFHELNQAYELLLDPIRKTALDTKLRTKLAQKERFAKFDVKRRGMQTELEEAERAAKRTKMDRAKEQRQREEEAERIKEEGRRMRAERQEEVARAEEARSAQSDGPNQEEQIKLGPLDTTVRLRYPTAERPELTTPAALCALLSRHGQVDESSIVISMKQPKKGPANTSTTKAPKRTTALVPFRTVWGAFAAVCASGKDRDGLKHVDVSWAGGSEPTALARLMQTRQNHPASGKSPDLEKQPFTKSAHVGDSKTPASTHFSSTPSFSFDASKAEVKTTTSPDVSAPDYEALTMMRLRQAERERLEREIREQEAVI